MLDGTCVLSFIRAQGNENTTDLKGHKLTTDPVLKQKIDEGVNRWREAFTKNRLEMFGCKTEEEQKKGLQKYSALINVPQKDLNGYKDMVISDIIREFDKEHSGNTDIESAPKAPYDNDPRDANPRYRYKCPFKYSHQSQNNAETGKFLSIFYKWDLIPDFMITEIVDFIGIEDFRISSNSMIERINQRMPEDATAADFERIAFDELAKIGNWHRQKELTWTLINEINTPELYNPTLLIALCKQIDNDKLLFLKKQIPYAID